MDHLRDGRGRVMDIPRDDRSFRTHHHAGRLQTDLDPMNAVVALLGGVVMGVDVERVVGTGLHAALATDAEAGVEVDYPVVSPEQRVGGTDRHAGSVGAVVAPHDREGPLGVGPGPRLDVLDPGAVHAQGYVMLGLARHRTGVAADARRLVDDEAELQWTPSIPDRRLLLGGNPQWCSTLPPESPDSLQPDRSAP